MRLSFKYTNYPLSPELTEKSKRVGRLTHPLYGIILGAVIMLVAGNLFPSAVEVASMLGVAGMIAGPILVVRFRKKKFAQFDAEYEKILQAARK